MRCADGPRARKLLRFGAAAIALALFGCGDAVSSYAGQEYERDAAPSDSGGALAPDAGAVDISNTQEEVCNGRDDDGDGKYDEGCPLPLTVDSNVNTRSVRLHAGRVVWLASDEGETVLWTARLPHGEPEELLRKPYWFDVGLNAERVVYGGRNQHDRRLDGFTVLDLRDGSEVFVPAAVPDAHSFSTPDLEGDYLAYSASLPIVCGGWCDEDEVYLHDLRTGTTQVVAPHARTIQYGPQLSGGQLVWWDDRFGHHRDEWGTAHWGDVMAAALPYEGGYRRLTKAPPDDMDIIAFEAGQALVSRYALSGLIHYHLIEVETGEVIPLDWTLRQGDRVLDMSDEHLLVRRDPLGDCHLELVHLETRRASVLDTQGYCPTIAQVDGDFVVWLKQLGSVVDLFWMDIGELP